MIERVDGRKGARTIDRWIADGWIDGGITVAAADHDNDDYGA
jgi:hypothetical protein